MANIIRYYSRYRGKPLLIAIAVFLALLKCGQVGRSTGRHIEPRTVE